MSPRFGGLALVAGTALFFPVASSRACGPDFPNCYLTESVDELARLPTLSLEAELLRLVPPDRRGARPPVSNEHEKPELAEIREALQAAGLNAGKISLRIATYSRLCPPPELPPEFQLYGRAARDWHDGRVENAVAGWRRLLALPGRERRHRTTWAAFMLGRALMDTDERAARAQFQDVRADVRQGFTDTADLAAASLGWEARLQFRRGETAEALRLYFEQFSSGDATAAASIQAVLARAFGNGDDSPGTPAPTAELRAIAADRNLRALVTAWFTARGGPYAPWSARASIRFQRWIAVLPGADALDPGEADRWAWAAYQNGLWEDAARFARRAPDDAPASEWVRGMLSLRAGDAAIAVDHLARAARAFPTDAALLSPLSASEQGSGDHNPEDTPASRLAGVRGVLALQREQYVAALQLFLDEGHWADAAYVAEQVLSVAELTEFVRRDTADLAAAPDAANRRSAMVDDLRHLLARRLVRNGDFRRAREFLPAGMAGHFDDFVAALRQGNRTELPKRTRAEALWQAAQILREYGLEIQGTELEPDYNLWGGDFQWPEIRNVRLERPWLRGAGMEDAGQTEGHTAFLASADESRRSHGIQLPSRRFHYRQRAAEIALLATTLLPDNDRLTATILNTAGNWLARRYPDDAEIYYKTLVFRCPDTDLGRAAAAERWLVRPED
jgi:hypothetical protein